MASLIEKIQSSPAPPTETVDNCLLCHSSKGKFLFWGFDRLNHLPGKFGVIQCEECELVRLSPRPAKAHLSFYYPPEDYYSYQEPKDSIRKVSQRGALSKVREAIRQVVFHDLGYRDKQLSTWQKLLRPFLARLFFKVGTYGWGKKFPRYKKDGVALDIGCGNGAYLSYLKHHGWKVMGVEISKQAAAVAKQSLDVDVFAGELEDFDFPPNSFDYIHMSHVLEHVTSPVETLERVRELLKPNGILYVEVPNYESLRRKISGKYWYAWETPKHLHMFSPQTLRRIFQKCGLTLTDMETTVVDLFAWDNTYKHEDLAGEKLTTRPFMTSQDKLRLFFLPRIVKLIHIFKPKSGDFICCWGRKDAE
jgi:2-polyprenyl-3-methyl-5-hydroxy-6-metoxy-1,4-benzoquinol methylase